MESFSATVIKMAKLAMHGRSDSSRHTSSFRHGKVKGAFRIAVPLKHTKDIDKELQNVMRSSKRRMLLSRIGAFLSMFGLFTTFAISEVCSYGYLPTEEEIQGGMQDPYALPGGGPCSESNAYKL